MTSANKFFLKYNKLVKSSAAFSRSNEVNNLRWCSQLGIPLAFSSAASRRLRFSISARVLLLAVLR